MFQVLCDQIEFANIIVLNKCNLVSEEERQDVRQALLQFNKMALIIETSNSEVEISKILNTSMFVFESAEANLKYLGNTDYLKSGSEKEGSITAFAYRRIKPYNPVRIHKLLQSNFMVDIDNNEYDEKNESFEDEGETRQLKDKCSKGHPLEVLYQSPYIHEGATMSVDCDICKTLNIHKNQFLHCNTCNEDICKSCMYKEVSDQGEDEDMSEEDENE